MPGQGSGKTVLIVEDDADVCRLVATVLASQGYKTIESRTGREALSLTLPDIEVLVTDLTLPDISGVTLIERFQPRFPGAGVVLMSGYAEVPRTKVDSLGMKWTFLAKPFPIQTLVDSVLRVAARFDARAA